VTGPAAPDWNPETYARFRGLRLRPALDLLAQLGPVPADGPLIDLGCGAGAVGPALALRFPGRALWGVDSSAAMLAEARAGALYARLEQADIALWSPEAPPALIFSNAALHWLGDHDRLLPRLAALLAPGGVLAVQMPRQYGLPSHRFLRDIAASMFPDRFDFASWEAPVRSASGYWELLAPLGQVSAWESEYVQPLPASAAGGHPVRHFTESTAMRPFLEPLSPAEAAGFVAAYDSALAAAYPLRPDGSALLPFRRVFAVLAT
jgi:trans-aconitate 2-methyltransferase